MKSMEQILEEYGVVPVVVIKNKEDAIPLADALYKGGLSCAEVTFRTDAAEESIRLMTEKYPDMLVGAGTVLTIDQVKRATGAGAKFIVSPGFDPEIVDYCLDNNIPVFPGCITPSEVAMMDEDYLYDWFGIDAELLIDHAWGRESTTIADIKAYRSKSKILSSGQVLMRDYKYHEGEIIAKEMMDQLCLDMAAKKLATDSVSLYVGYSYTQGVSGAGGTAKLAAETNIASMLVPAIETLYHRIVDPRFVIRRVCLSCNNVVEDKGVLQLNMFEDTSKQLRDKALQETMLGIRAKYGKNSILKGMNFDPAATGRERNLQIGGHRSG